MSSKIIFTGNELFTLFPNALQREVFVTGINRLIESIEMRTIAVPFLKLELKEI